MRKMFILTDGKYYVMENPLKAEEYLKTTSPTQAKEFTYKQAKGILQRKGKKLSWCKGFEMVNLETGKKASKKEVKYKGKAGLYIGDNDVDFNKEILDKITQEAKSILGLAGWDINQLNTYKNELNIGLSKYDSAEQDVVHVLEEYRKKHNGKKPPAHKISKLGYLLEDIRVLRRRIKQCLAYVEVMVDAITYKYDIGKIRLEISKAEHVDYKGRTEYYKIAEDILN